MHKTPIRILMIDDDEEDFILTRDLISETGHNTYTIEWVNNFTEGIKKIFQKNHDVCLVDYQLGANNGLELIK